MENFLYRIKNIYNLSLGEFCFSPLIESSLGISLKYIEDLRLEKSFTPLFICFPKKEVAALWISIGLLRNYFFENYIYQTNNRIVELGIRIGDYVEIFGCCSQYLGINNGVKLRFKDASITASLNVLPYINTTSRNRLNKLDLFKGNRKNLLSSRNAISKILEPSSDLVINPKNLNAQVLLITGRGNAKYIRNEFRGVKVYGEALSTIFSENINLIIKTDLEEYLNIFKDYKTKDPETFVMFFNDACKRTIESDPELGNELNKLKKLVDKGEFRSKEFYTLFHELIESFSNEEYQFLENLKEIYPGVLEELPQNLRAVVINDITLINLYQKTIDGFINSKIPVIVISDRQIQENEDIRFYENFFSLNPKYNRINFDKNKIKALSNLSLEDEFLDNKLWNAALKYARQEVSVKVFQPTNLDNILPQIQKVIKELDGFELLKKSYYCFFQPAAYVLKNSQSGYDTIYVLVEEFEREFFRIKNNINPDYKSVIEKGLELLKKGEPNTKSYDINDNLYVTQLSAPNGDKIYIPADARKEIHNNKNSKRITFTGFPVNEFLSKSLINAVSSDFYPEVNILCWPNEGKLAFQYLRRRVLSGYFTDNLSDEWGFPSGSLLSNAQDFQLEVDKYLRLDQSVVQVQEGFENQENDLFEISNFRYNGFQREGNFTTSYKVSCKIVDFEDNSFMFLPLNSKVLSQLESEHGLIRFRNTCFNELKKGYRIYKYGKNRADQRILAKSVPALESAFDELEDWRNCLLKLYDESGKDLKFLEDYLSEIKIKEGLPGSPTRQNIQRWLFDDEMHAPEEENLILIYKASPKENIDKQIANILEAKRKITSFNRRIDREVKIAISNKLTKLDSADKSGLLLNIHGVNVQVESKVISGLQSFTLETDYYNTRKFLK